MKAEQITIDLPQQQEEQRSQIERSSGWAHSLTIDTVERRKEAATGIRGLKKVRRNIADFFSEAKRAAHQAHRAICTAENTMAEPVEAAIREAERKAIAWDTEQRRLQAEAERKAREEAEKERRRLEAIAKRTKDEEKREAWKAAAEAVEAAPVAPVAKHEGEIRRTVWRAELVDLAALLKAAAGGDANAASLLKFDQSTADRMAAIHKAPDVVPGVKFTEQITLSHRA